MSTIDAHAARSIVNLRREWAGLRNDMATYARTLREGWLILTGQLGSELFRSQGR